LTVAENLALNTLIEHRTWFVRRRAVRDIARRAIAPLGVALDLDRPLGDLPMAERQGGHRARRAGRPPRHPRRAHHGVDGREVASLFAVVRRLTGQGVAVLFVSHKIREMLRISDRVPILRNGSVAEAGPAAGFDDMQVARAMTGRTLRGRRHACPPRGPPLLRSAPDEPAVARRLSSCAPASVWA
jgi:simple sugar transport system ATP-binding protein